MLNIESFKYYAVEVFYVCSGQLEFVQTDRIN